MGVDPAAEPETTALIQLMHELTDLVHWTNAKAVKAGSTPETHPSGRTLALGALGSGKLFGRGLLYSTATYWRPPPPVIQTGLPP